VTRGVLLIRPVSCRIFIHMLVAF